jgi:hypothetical protein
MKYTYKGRMLYVLSQLSKFQNYFQNLKMPITKVNKKTYLLRNGT